MEENNIAFRRSGSRLSMLDKSLERRRVNKEHNSNFRAGYVAVHEEHLHKTGLRGRKRFLAYLLLFLIFAVALANLALTVLIVLALQINQNGSDVMSFQRDGGGGIRFKTEVTAEKVLSDPGEFGGYRAQDLKINGDGQPVVLQHMAGQGASVEFNGGDTIMRSEEGLHIINPATGNTILHTANDSGIPSPTGMKQLSSSQVITRKISPSKGDDLSIEADETFTMQGNEGLTINGREIDMSGANVILNAFNAITLEAGPSGGIYLNTTLLPKRSAEERPPGSTRGYALCVCPDTGAIFQVAARRRVPHPCGLLTTNPCIG